MIKVKMRKIDTNKVLTLQEMREYPKDDATLLCDECGEELNWDGMSDENVDGLTYFYWGRCENCDIYYRFVPLVFQIQKGDI